MAMFGIPDTIMYLVGGYLLKEQLAPKVAPAPAAPAQLMPWHAPGGRDLAAPQGPYAPGMPVEVSSRKPIGPVALDAHIEPHTEEGVWKCLSETNVEAARKFAVALAQSGLPVAAGVVSYHVHVLAQVKAVQEAQAAQIQAQTEAMKAQQARVQGPNYGEAPPAPPAERKPRATRNGAPVVDVEAPAPFEPKPAPAGG